MPKQHALVVDDTFANRNFLSRLLMQANFEVTEAATGQEALDALYNNDAPTIELAVIDMELPDMNGLQLAMRTREKLPESLIVMATMLDDVSWVVKSFEAGCDIYLVKPHGFMELFQRLTTNSLVDLHKEDNLIIDQYGPRKFTTS